MLSVEIKVHGKLVKWIGISNTHPCGITKGNKHGVHPYRIFDKMDNEIGFVTHCRKDGILHLVDNVMTMIGQKMWLMGDEEAKKLGDPV